MVFLDLQVGPADELPPRQAVAQVGPGAVGEPRGGVDGDPVQLECLDGVVVVSDDDFQVVIVVDVADADVQPVAAVAGVAGAVAVRVAARAGRGCCSAARPGSSGLQAGREPRCWSRRRPGRRPMRCSVSGWSWPRSRCGRRRRGRPRPVRAPPATRRPWWCPPASPPSGSARCSAIRRRRPRDRCRRRPRGFRPPPGRLTTWGAYIRPLSAVDPVQQRSVAAEDVEANNTRRSVGAGRRRSRSADHGGCVPAGLPGRFHAELWLGPLRRWRWFPRPDRGCGPRSGGVPAKLTGASRFRPAELPPCRAPAIPNPQPARTTRHAYQAHEAQILANFEP